MAKRRIKVYYFVLEAMGSLACGFYGNYVFFLLRDQYGLGNLGNLSVSAFQGLVFGVAAWQGGRFAQRHGYFTALRLGLAGLLLALLAGRLLPGLALQLAVLAAWTASMCFIWPALEALVSEGEPDGALPQMVGIYNVVWATCSAVSYFIGGALIDRLGLQSMFWLPIGVHALQLLLVGWLAPQYAMDAAQPARARLNPKAEGRGPKEARSPRAEAAISGARAPTARTLLLRISALFRPSAFGLRHSAPTRGFLHMAWLANPFACIGINTVLALIPGLARELHLSTTEAGLFCSLWFFARLAAFIALWQWQGWHYRFRWLLGAFLGLLGGFATLLMAREFWALALAQVVFGLSVGLIYYSSLYYSMNAGTAQGEHGGLHEAAMGAGNCVGPAVGAAALWLAPGIAHAGTYAVSGLLVVGLAGLLGLQSRRVLAPARINPSV